MIFTSLNLLSIVDAIQRLEGLWLCAKPIINQ